MTTAPPLAAAEWYALDLADGSRLALGHAEAAELLTRIARAMRLEPIGAPEARQQIRLALRGGASSGQSGVDLGPLIHASLQIFHGLAPRGAILIHGALAETRGRGVVLAGSAQVGKTTAFERLPPPWHGRCDDTTLVVRDAKGAFFAHPWPTWSRFWPDGAGGQWDVQRGVPLSHLFVLRQAARERVLRLGPGEAAGAVLGCSEQVTRLLYRTLEPEEIRRLRTRFLDSISALVRAVPCHRLELTRFGPFWQEIERVAA